MIKRVVTSKGTATIENAVIGKSVVIYESAATIESTIESSIV